MLIAQLDPSPFESASKYAVRTRNNDVVTFVFQMLFELGPSRFLTAAARTIERELGASVSMMMLEICRSKFLFAVFTLDDTKRAFLLFMQRQVLPGTGVSATLIGAGDELKVAMGFVFSDRAEIACPRTSRNGTPGSIFGDNAIDKRIQHMGILNRERFLVVWTLCFPLCPIQEAILAKHMMASGQLHGTFRDTRANRTSKVFWNRVLIDAQVLLCEPHGCVFPRSDLMRLLIEPD